MKKRQQSNSAIVRETQHKLIYECPAPYVSAQSWCVLDRTKMQPTVKHKFTKSGKSYSVQPSFYSIATSSLLFGRCEEKRRQVASLTKVMTSYCVF